MVELEVQPSQVEAMDAGVVLQTWVEVTVAEQPLAQLPQSAQVEAEAEAVDLVVTVLTVPQVPQVLLSVAFLEEEVVVDQPSQPSAAEVVVVLALLLVVVVQAFQS